MGFEGMYKAAQTARFVEGKGLVFEDIDTVYARTTDEEEKHMLEQTMRSLIMVDELGNINYVMEIPEGTPAAELEKAKSRGMKVTEDGKYLVTRTEGGKVEDGALYLYDKSKFLAGTEWVKISTEVEDELNLITTLYKRV